MPISTISDAELLLDIEQTYKDVLRLEAICVNLEKFIYDSDQDRRSYSTDLYKYQSILTQGRDLLSKLEALKEERNTKQ